MSRFALAFSAAAVLAAVLFVAGLACGPVDIPLGDVAAALLGKDGLRPEVCYIVAEGRLPQALCAALCGSSLAVSGLVLQTAFGNPLAGPSVFGVSGGAGLGVAVVMMVCGGGMAIGGYGIGGAAAVMAAAFAGAMAVMAAVWGFSTVVSRGAMLLVVGVMIGYVASSAVAILNYLATAEGVKAYFVWGLGSFSSASLSLSYVYLALSAVGMAWAAVLTKPLNAMLLGDSYAVSMGVDVGRVRRSMLVCAGLLCAVSTAFCGPVSFIGLAVPHIARMVSGSQDHRKLLPLSAVCGAAMALACNLASSMPSLGMLPVGALTPLIGAPVVVYVAVRGAGIRM